jgi:pectate lyase
MRITLIFILFTFHISAQVFPGAKGFGADWVFTNDYTVLIVDSLTDDGQGYTLRDALDETIGTTGRIIVFNGLSGIITLNGTAVNIPSNTYIAGQTSDNGIWLRQASTAENNLMNTTGDNVIVRGITFAIGATESGAGDGNLKGDNFNIFANASNVILDRCTFLWSTDENFSITAEGGTQIVDVTVQNCLIAESLNYATHAYTQVYGNYGWTEARPHSMGMLVNNVDRLSYYGNVFAHNNQRNPLVQTLLSNGEFVNNIIYNRGAFGFVVEAAIGSQINYINNYVKDGPNTSIDRYGLALDDGTYYVENNINTQRPLESDPEWNAFAAHDNNSKDPANVAWQTGTPHNYPLKDEPYIHHLALVDSLENNAGTFVRHSHETRILGHISGGTGGFIDDPADVGGYPTIASGTIIADADNDGIPDSEEATWVDDTFGYVNALAITKGAEGNVPEPQVPVSGNTLGKITKRKLLKLMH